MIRALLFAALLIPSAVYAKDGNRQETKPKPTQTTQQCKNGQVWDKSSKTCVRVQGSLLDDDTLYGAVREFAYAGQYENAQAALAAMSDQDEDRVLTYWGFTHRNLGHMDKGMEFYELALAKNPSNITARSYMGQALVLQGDMDAAREQLAAIREIDGKGSWAEESLAIAVSTGKTYNY